MTSIEDYKTTLDSLKRYTSIQEKEALLYVMDENHTATEVCKILGANPKNEFEAIAFIYKLREISVSDLIEITNLCSNPSCKFHDIHQVQIPKMFWKDEEDIKTDVPIGLFENLDSIEEDINNINILSLSEYNIIEEKILSNNFKIFDPKVNIICKRCGNVESTVINYASIISKFSISNVYEQFFDISYFSNMTKNDTNNMYPFEREIFIGLIQSKEDEIEKANKK